MNGESVNNNNTSPREVPEHVRKMIVYLMHCTAVRPYKKYQSIHHNMGQFWVGWERKGALGIQDI